MRRSLLAVMFSAAVLMMIQLGGCGGENDNVSFGDCGNGVLDSGEQCDDGNTADDDGCLSTCINARCGDGFLNGGVEECDGSNLGGESCSSLGLGGGTLSCNANCTFDESSCGSGLTPTPSPQSTPSDSGTAGGTPSASGDLTPTATATPGGGGVTCAAGDMITATITLTYDAVSFPDVSGVTTTVDYPGGALNIPGTGNEQSVAMRVTDLTGSSGNLLQVSDSDTTGDTTDERLVVGILNLTTPIPSGQFARVQFDCREGQSAPTASAFTCTVDASNLSGSPVQATCSVTVTGP